MALVGYARTSTVDQIAGLEAQVRDLRAAGVGEQELFVEQVSSIGQRAKLDEALRFVRRGDDFVVTKLDRLARSTRDLLSIVELLDNKSVALRILDFGGASADTRSPQGRLILTMFGAMAQFERELMLERQREGIAKAKSAKKYKGRAPTAMRKADEILRLTKEGVGAAEIARICGIGRASVYRVLKASELNPGSI
ncbi:MAG: recombinase family protein [Hyphomicrobiales bacterium]|nr:MAG: recombinase family protein [Hyphomicrobiales bacterium]